MILLILALVELTGPENQRIEINPEQVVTLRKPRGAEHFAVGIQCIVNTVDGKFILVKENCSTVQKKLKGEQ